MLNQLVEYAKNIDSEPGFTSRNIRWEVLLSSNGRLINILPLGDDKSGEHTSKCPDMHNMVAGGRAHFLIETLQTVSLFCKANDDPKKIADSQVKHAYFVQMISDAASICPVLQPLQFFMNDAGHIAGLREKFSQEKAKPTDWLRWKIAGIDPLHQPELLNWWRAWRQADQGVGDTLEVCIPGKKRNNTKDNVDMGMVCFLSGNILKPLSTHRKITGLSSVGGLSMGDVLVGFDKTAFCSFGLKQASNSAIGEKHVSEYVDALNDLIKKHSRKLANTLVVHWFKETVPPEDDPLSFLYEPPEQTEATAVSSARQILESLRKGQRPVPPNNRYFALTISGASGRVMVRDWMEGSFEDLIDKIEQWFADLEIVVRVGRSMANDPKFMAVCGALVRELKDLPPQTTTSLWRSAMLGLPIPQPFLAQALARFRSDLLNDKPFNHARMGLMKAYFIRKGGNHNMNTFLNKEHPEAAYQCGRLLAVLADLQRSALGEVGAGVVQRYYVAASQSPGLMLGRLIGNAKNHLNKLEGGLAYWYEDQIAEIMSHIQDQIPATLNLEGQGLFALGYYQQIAARRTGSKNHQLKNPKEEITNE